jgi:hypothetical protein
MPEDRSGSILKEIEKRNVEPIPRWHFFLRHFAFWMLATISVLTGSLAMATAIYVFLDNDYLGDHDYINQYFVEQPFIAHIIKSIPYVWIVALVLFIIVAYYGFRHTKRGYRYPTVKVIAGAVLVSIFLSICMNMVDVGGYIHRYLVENVHSYPHLINSNEYRWSQANKGRLGGKVMAFDRQNSILLLKSFRNRYWQIDVSKAEIQAGTVIAPGRYLKITGDETGGSTFKARDIQGWEKKYHKRPRVQPKINPVQPTPEKPR